MSIDEVIATIPEECIRDLHSSDVTYIAEQVSHKLLSFYYTLNIEKLHEKAVRKEEENKRRRERSRQKREEHFRASLRHLEPRLGPNATWKRRESQYLSNILISSKQHPHLTQIRYDVCACACVWGIDVLQMTTTIIKICSGNSFIRRTNNSLTYVR
jgi:hypothetical protein